MLCLGHATDRQEGVTREMRRFEGRWRKWDEAVREGKKPHEFLPSLSDESCIELMASGDPGARRYELNLLATELQNRLSRLRRLVNEASEEAERYVGAAVEAAEEAAREAHAAEEAIKAHLATRGDALDHEAEHAEKAARHAERVREALRKTEEAKERLTRAAAELDRHARHPPPH